MSFHKARLVLFNQALQFFILKPPYEGIILPRSTVLNDSLEREDYVEVQKKFGDSPEPQIVNQWDPFAVMYSVTSVQSTMTSRVISQFKITR